MQCKCIAIWLFSGIFAAIVLTFPNEQFTSLIYSIISLLNEFSVFVALFLYVCLIGRLFWLRCMLKYFLNFLTNF